MTTDRSRRLSSALMFLGLLLTLAFPLFSGPIPVAKAATTVTLAGSLQSELGCPGDWQPDCATTHMTAGADGIYRFSGALPAGNYEYKAALNDTWDVNYGAHAASGGANIALTVPAGGATVKFYFDPNTHWITDNINSLIVTAAGSFQSEIGCPGDWQPSCLISWMEDIQGTGIYTYSTPNTLPPGQYEFKAATGEDWSNPNYGQGGGGANVPFTISKLGQVATLKFDAATHIPTANTGQSSHDNNVEYSGLGHDSRNSLYRVPFGAVNPGTAVTLRFRTFHNDATAVTIRLYDTSLNREDKEPMTLAASNVDCYDAALTGQGHSCDYYTYTYTPQALATVYYRFIVQDGTSTAYYADTANRYDGLGVATSDLQDNGFRLNVVDPKFKVIPWMQNGVMYQIFPDRFRNGDPSNDPKTTDPRYDYPAPPNATPAQQQAAADTQIIKKVWSALPEGYCRNYVSPATPCTEGPKGRDYFGGDLEGVDQKLGYLAGLGITIIYFNPIFESGSNHGYDTRDYKNISKYFGTNETFKRLVNDARRFNISIVLDGVFNHLSSDSPFFDRYHHYSSVGACEDVSSPYRSWFGFHDVAVGTGVCADSQNRPNSATYDGWAGFDSIPVITKKDPANPANPYAPVANYFYANAFNSVASFWLRQGARGWRFDVMTDASFPASYWQQLRQVTKGVNPDEILIAEAWHWYDNLPLTHGDQADTAMGYRFRNAVLGLLGAVDDKGFPQESDPNLPPSVFQNRLESMREDYADATYYTFQNLLDSHDTKRVLWSLTPGNENREDKEFNAANLATGKAKELLAATVQFTVPGTPTIYYGDEVSLTGADDPDDRRAFPWKLNANGTYANSFDPFYSNAGGDHNTLNYYRTLALIRSTNPVLRQGKLTFLLADDTHKTTAYAMRDKNQLVITVLNVSGTSQNITIPTANYLRNNIRFIDVLNGRSITTGNGSFTINLGSLKAAILVMIPGQDISGPAAPVNLKATTTNGLTSTVGLTWQAGPGDKTYNVYRSPVQGGGYVKIGASNTTSYADNSVANGTTYYYLVRGLDALGNEGGPSNEANATPAFPIGYAVLQYPKTINRTLSADYTTVYGQIYIQGLTDEAGDPGAILAQLAYGASGSDPATWNWQPMTFNSGHSGDNNYEYQGELRTDTAGTFNYLVRFSDDGGRTWVYGDQDGYVPGQAGSSGTNQPGVLTVTPNADTTPPSAPVASIDYSATSLSLSWTASSDPGGSIAEYRIYRGTSPGGEAATPVATVPGSATSYLDTSVAGGQTYYYVVKAFDQALNASPASNEVSHKVEAKIIHVTFKVKVPGWTPAGDTVYLSGDQDNLCGYCGGNAATAMTQTAPGIWQITLDFPDGQAIQYKYTRGTYDYVEEWGSIAGFTNRTVTIHSTSPSNLNLTIDDTSDTTSDDNHHSVKNWRDAIVTGKVASASGVTVSFNWAVNPETGKTLNDTVVVTTSGGAAIAGTVAYGSDHTTLVFTPSAPLATGNYNVTVDHVVSVTQNNDGIKIKTPYVFNFTV